MWRLDVLAEKGGIHDAATQGLFRQQDVERDVQLSCGEHADYGLLTLVNQEDHMTALQAGSRHATSSHLFFVPCFRFCVFGFGLGKKRRVGLSEPTPNQFSPPLPRASFG